MNKFFTLARPGGVFFINLDLVTRVDDHQVKKRADCWIIGTSNPIPIDGDEYKPFIKVIRSRVLKGMTVKSKPLPPSDKSTET